MATNWTESNIGSSSWKDANPGPTLVQEDGSRYIGQEDGSSLFGLEGVVTSWGEINLGDSSWSYEGFLIYLNTESRFNLMTEGNGYAIVIRKPGSWREESLGTAIWTEVNIT